MYDPDVFHEFQPPPLPRWQALYVPLTLLAATALAILILLAWGVLRHAHADPVDMIRESTGTCHIGHNTVPCERWVSPCFKGAYLYYYPQFGLTRAPNNQVVEIEL